MDGAPGLGSESVTQAGMAAPQLLRLQPGPPASLRMSELGHKVTLPGSVTFMYCPWSEPSRGGGRPSHLLADRLGCHQCYGHGPAVSVTASGPVRQWTSDPARRNSLSH